MGKKKWIILAVCLLLLSITIALGTLLVQRQITNTATVAKTGKIGIYRDQACTQGLSDIQWGTFDWYQLKQTIFYIRNEGNTALDLTYLITGDLTYWAPGGYFVWRDNSSTPQWELSLYANGVWYPENATQPFPDYDRIRILEDQVREIKLTLRTWEPPEMTLTFTMTINGNTPE